MIENTFCHLPGIGLRTERALWEQGTHSWQAFLRSEPDCLPLGGKRLQTARSHIGHSIEHLGNRNGRYFADRLQAGEHWRLFSEFRDTVAYLDIETTGLGGPSDIITTICLYDGATIRTYVNGHNLDRFSQDIGVYRLLVTYNGKCFDLPFIRSYFGLELDQVHIDLRYVLAGLGYRGGLKGCERQFGLDRHQLEGVDGFFAVLLWQHYQSTGDRRALETLLAYNIQDTVNLETLMVHAYNLKVSHTPFGESRQLALPKAPVVPLEADPGIIETIRDRYYRLNGW